MADEIWRDIDGYEGKYQISNFGRVKSFKYGQSKILKPVIVKNGYLHVTLCNQGKTKSCTIHRLVAKAFINNPDNKPQVNHKNGIKTDNHANNLEWVTGSDNQRHAITTGLRATGEKCSWAKLSIEQMLAIRNNADNLTTVQLAEEFNVRQCTISAIQLGKIWKSAGGTIRRPKYQRIPPKIRNQIRSEYRYNVPGHGAETLAKKFGVSARTVLKIIHEID